MAKAVLTEEQVFEAADSLVAEGKDVTALNLLARLGAGSLTTIYKYLFAWKSARQSDQNGSSNWAIPDSVQSSFANAWKVAATEAAREIAHVKEKAREEVQTAKQEIADALAVIERLETESEADQLQLQQLNEKLERLQNALAGIENEKAALKATADQLAQQVKSQESQIERLHRDLEQERKRHSDEVARATTTAEEMRKERDTALREAASASGQLEALKEQNREILNRIGDKGKGR